MRKTKWKVSMMAATVLIIFSSLTGMANASMDNMQMNGTELVPLREIAEKLGYSVAWNSEERSVTLTYMGMMRDDTMMEDDGMMQDDMMMEDDGMMRDDTMMEDDGMMRDDMMMEESNMGMTIKVWIGLEMLTVDGKPGTLDTAPSIHRKRTYVSSSFVEKYLKAANSMH